VNKKWYEPVAEFAGHFLAGLLIFAMIASAAAGIWWIISQLKASDVDPPIIWALQFVEYLLLAFDVALFVTWVVSSAWSAYNSMKEKL
jgi:hypothetical protein